MLPLAVSVAESAETGGLISSWERCSASAAGALSAIAVVGRCRGIYLAVWTARGVAGLRKPIGSSSCRVIKSMVLVVAERPQQRRPDARHKLPGSSNELNLVIANPSFVAPFSSHFLIALLHCHRRQLSPCGSSVSLSEPKRSPLTSMQRKIW